jgi:hypothetical protein
MDPLTVLPRNSISTGCGKESPEKYEAYVDLESGAWTKYRIVTDGTKARLFVLGAAQSCLILNDMKFGDPEGAVAVMVSSLLKNHYGRACHFWSETTVAARTQTAKLSVQILSLLFADKPSLIRILKYLRTAECSAQGSLSKKR